MEADVAITHPVWVDYTNYRGERRVRAVLPLKVVFAATAYHPTPQWLLVVTDLERGEERTLAFSGIHGFPAAGPPL